MKSYRVSFILMPKNVDDKEEFLGNVVIDDNGVDDINMTLVSKAFRHCDDSVLRADKVSIERIN